MNKYDTLSFNIVEIIKTRKDASLFIESLDSLIESLFHLDINIDHKLDEFFSFEIKEKLINLCKKNSVNLANVMDFRKFLIDLKDITKNIPIVTIYIAFDAREENIKNIIDWFFSNIKTEAFVDVVIDKNIIAGAILVFKGIRRDYSVKKKIEEKFGSGSYFNVQKVEYVEQNSFQNPS